MVFLKPELIELFGRHEQAKLSKGQQRLEHISTLTYSYRFLGEFWIEVYGEFAKEKMNYHIIKWLDHNRLGIISHLSNLKNGVAFKVRNNACQQFFLSFVNWN